MMKILKIVWIIAKKDLVTEFRGKDLLISQLVFSILTISIFAVISTSFVGTIDRSVLAGGVFFTALTFSGGISFSRSFSSEYEKGTHITLLVAPIGNEIIYLGKLLANFVFITISALITLPLVAVIFDALQIFSPETILVVLLANLGFAIAGTTYSAIGAGLKSFQLLVTLLFVPSVFPNILAGVQSLQMIIDGQPISEFSQWLAIMAGFIFIFLLASLLMIDLIMEESI